MTQFIGIDWVFGRPSNGADQEEERAIRAAEAVLDAFCWRAGQPEPIDYIDAEAAYARHMSDEVYNRSERDTKLIAAWEAAEKAANLALTDGWHNPNGAGCSIRAYSV